MISYCKKLLKDLNLKYLTCTETGTNSVHLNKIPFLNMNQFGMLVLGAWKPIRNCPCIAKSTPHVICDLLTHIITLLSLNYYYYTLRYAGGSDSQKVT